VTPNTHYVFSFKGRQVVIIIGEDRMFEYDPIEDSYGKYAFEGTLFGSTAHLNGIVYVIGNQTKQTRMYNVEKRRFIVC
jgi:hypothetical protein